MADEPLIAEHAGVDTAGLEHRRKRTRLAQGDDTDQMAAPLELTGKARNLFLCAADAERPHNEDDS